MLNRDSFIHISAFMINELELKGNELLAYAIIYGFSQDGESEFTGGNSYLCEWLGTSKQTVINVLKSLMTKGYIRKIEKTVNHVRFNSYQAVLDWDKKNADEETEKEEPLDEKSDIEENIQIDEKSSEKEVCIGGQKILPGVKKFDGGGQKILPGVVKKFDQGGQKILPNNIYNNIYNNKLYIKGGGKASPPTLEDIKNYAEEIGAIIDPETFFEYYQSINWEVNGSVIDWKTKFRRWNREEKSKKKEPGKTSGKTTMAMQRSETSSSMNELERTLLSRQM